MELFFSVLQRSSGSFFPPFLFSSQAAISKSSFIAFSHLSLCLCRRKTERKMNCGSNLETRSLMDEIRSFEKSCYFDLGHPLLNRIAESFVKAAGVGAIQAVTREAYLNGVEAAGIDSNGLQDIGGAKKTRFPNLKGETSKKSLEAMVKSTGKESIQWGMAAGMYSGITYGLREARGSHDWKNSAVAGAITGAALAITTEDASHEQIVQCAITGAALSTAANLLTGIF